MWRNLGSVLYRQHDYYAGNDNFDALKALLYSLYYSWTFQLGDGYYVTSDATVGRYD